MAQSSRYKPRLLFPFMIGWCVKPQLFWVWVRGQLPKCHPIPYVVHYFWPALGNRVQFGTQALSQKRGDSDLRDCSHFSAACHGGWAFPSEHITLPLPSVFQRIGWLLGGSESRESGRNSSVCLCCCSGPYWSQLQGSRPSSSSSFWFALFVSNACSIGAQSRDYDTMD